ncbi:MAG: Uma2 family endonuclease [Archangium sp.]|nr:Uma2 family endonuclease [Archangium sp.]
MSTARRLHYSMQDYLSAAEISVVKLEYFDGEIFCMAGGTPEHAAIAAETTIRIGSKLKAGCQAFSADARIHVESTGVSHHSRNRSDPVSRRVLRRGGFEQDLSGLIREPPSPLRRRGSPCARCSCCASRSRSPPSLTLLPMHPSR